MKGFRFNPYWLTAAAVSAVVGWTIPAGADIAPTKKTATPAVADAAKPSSPEDARRAKVAATVNGAKITLADMEDALASQPPMFRQEYTSKEKQQELLNILIQGKLLAQEAARRGFDKDSEVTAITKNKLASLMHKSMVEDAEKASPSEEDLKKYYDEHIDDYHKPEKMRARHILMKDKVAAEAKLKELLSKKVELHEFRKIAKELTQNEDDKKNGGDLGFFTRVDERKEEDSKIPAPLVEAAFSLKKNGEIYPKLISTEDGFHLLMRTGYRSKLDIPFEESKARIEVLVRRDQRRDAVETGIEKLKEKSPVEIYEENLKHVVIDLSDGASGTP